MIIKEDKKQLFAYQQASQHDWPPSYSLPRRRRPRGSSSPPSGSHSSSRRVDQSEPTSGACHPPRFPPLGRYKCTEFDCECSSRLWIPSPRISATLDRGRPLLGRACLPPWWHHVLLGSWRRDRRSLLDSRFLETWRTAPVAARRGPNRRPSWVWPRWLARRSLGRPERQRPWMGESKKDKGKDIIFIETQDSIRPYFYPLRHYCVFHLGQTLFRMLT